MTYDLTRLFKIPLPSCSSHAGLLSHLSLRRRRRAVPAGMVENGNSGPRRSGKLWIGAWRAEGRGAGSVPCHPLASRQGCCIFPSSFSVTPPPSVLRRMLAVRVVLLVGCSLLIKLLMLSRVVKVQKKKFQC